MYRKHVPLPIPVAEVSLVQAPVTDIPMGAPDVQPWYKRLRSQYPHTFKGGTDQLKAERWLPLITFKGGSELCNLVVEGRRSHLVGCDRTFKECAYHVVGRVLEGIWQELF